MSRRILSSILLLSMFIVTMTWVPTIPLAINNSSNINLQDDSSPINVKENEDTLIEELEFLNSKTHNLAYDAPIEGILNPVEVEQSGYAASENISARTDSYQNLGYDLPLDVDHNWIADQAEVSVWNLERLYAINGSFSEGIPGINENPDGNPDGTAIYYPLGWSANSTDGPSSYTDDVQYAAYDATGRQYVTVESQGAKEGQNAFAHVAGTRIVWTQFVQNAPYTEDFLFSFDYFYLRGPIDGPDGNDPVVGNCSIALFIDGAVVWNMSLLLLSQRGVWLSSGVIPITVSGVASSFQLELGLIIDEELILDKRDDYDGDPGHIADGIGNAAYITAYLDDVSFIKSIPPTAEQVQLEFTTGGVSETLTGSLGTYYASIPNASYWTSTPVQVALTSNTSISFDYKTRLYSHRFTDSNWRNDISSFGVSYFVDHGLSSDLTFYTYVGYLGEYEDPEMTVVFPSDWENLTVSDPFLTDLTGTCIIGSGYVTVPTSIINRLGWWEVKLESPNYAKSIKSQILDAGWSDETIFRINDETRADITIGTDTQTLGLLTDVNITWFKPSDVIWVTELRSGGILGQIYSSSQIFTSGSSPAGLWWIEVSWENGTEVAYDRAQFEVHHSANLVADPAEITTDTGLTIKGIVRYTDGDTGAYLTDASAILVANWSGSSIPLIEIRAQNWWEADFDTSITGAGEFIIVVNASQPYYDDVSCQITVRSILVTRLTSPNAPWTSDEWGHIVSLTYLYEYFDPNTETWSSVENVSGTVSASINWTSAVVTDSGSGFYVAYLDSSLMDSGTYLINATFSNPHHQSKQILLTLIISQMTSSLTISQELSARVNISESYILNMSYTDSGGNPVTDAIVIVDNVVPPTGLFYTGISEKPGEPGNFTITLTPQGAGVFTIRFVANSTNAQDASAVFVLVVNDVETQVVILGTGSVDIGLTDVYNMTFRYEMLNGTGIENAYISIIYSGGVKDALSWDLAEATNGDYSVEFSSIASGTYLITIAAFKQYYQRATNAFFLIVGEISTNFTSLNGTADLVSFGKDYQLFVSYSNGSGYGLDGANVSIVNAEPEVGLTWENATPHGQGIYSIVITPQVANTFTLLVQAKHDNHETGFVLFTLTSTSIATTLVMLNASTTIAFDQNFTVNLLFQDEDLSGLEDASITIQNSPAGVSFSEIANLTNGYYQVTITPLEVGTFDIVFKASKNGYQNGYTSFTLGAIRIPTSLRTASGLSSDTMMFSDEYNLIVLYERLDTDFNVSTATIDVQGVPSTGFSYSIEETINGYVVTIIPERVGGWTFTITAQLEGYASSSIEFVLNANPIEIQAEMISGLTAVEGTEFDITVRVTTKVTNDPVTGALVSFRMTPGDTPPAGEFIGMEETSTPGIYSASYSIPLYLDTTQYTLEIKIEKDNYVLIGEVFTQSFAKYNDDVLRWTPIIIGGSSFVIAFVALLAVVQINSRRRKAQLATDLINKRRFDDADNIIGVIVMHKRSGIPVYSRIVKGGFEEGIVAAFISAVTHFRQEFEMFDEEAMKVIPISDIIRAVQTRNLICAFITMRSASIEHNRKMEDYGMQVATYLDDFYTESRPTGTLDSRIAEILDYVYDETMDGNLIKFYKAEPDQKFPRRYRILEQLFEDIVSRHCSRPVYLAHGLATYGVSEAHGCTLVLEAIEKSIIVQCEEHEPTIEDMEFTDFFKKRNSKDTDSST